jgi:hypothetical protein
MERQVSELALID